MEPLDKILKSAKPEQPPQVEALKKYATDNYGVEISVVVSPKYYLVNAPNAAIAQKLRVDTLKITSVCNLDKRLVIHIGN